MIFQDFEWVPEPHFSLKKKTSRHPKETKKKRKKERFICRSFDRTFSFAYYQKKKKSHSNKKKKPVRLIKIPDCNCYGNKVQSPNKGIFFKTMPSY